MSLKDDFGTEFIAEAFEYLDGLRLSGVTNMGGAAAYLIAEFEIERKPARDLLTAWMFSFSDAPVEDRVAAALGDDK